MTSENVFSAVLTFSIMAGGTVAFGSDLLRSPEPRAAVAVLTLPAVTVVGHRIAAGEPLTLPTVTVVGRRVAATAVAVETGSVEQRVQ